MAADGGEARVEGSGTAAAGAGVDNAEDATEDSAGDNDEETGASGRQLRVILGSGSAVEASMLGKGSE